MMMTGQQGFMPAQPQMMQAQPGMMGGGGGAINLDMNADFTDNTGLTRKPCRIFFKSGACRYGTTCIFAHLGRQADGTLVCTNAGVRVQRPPPAQAGMGGGMMQPAMIQPGTGMGGMQTVTTPGAANDASADARPGRNGTDDRRTRHGPGHSPPQQEA